MTKSGKKILAGLDEALKVAKGEQPAAAIWHNGHKYVPAGAKPPVQFAPYDAPRLICEAITEMFGDRCPDFDEGCATCAAWQEWDRLYADTRAKALEALAETDGEML